MSEGGQEATITNSLSAIIKKLFSRLTNPEVQSVAQPLSSNSCTVSVADSDLNGNVHGTTSTLKDTSSSLPQHLFVCQKCGYRTVSSSECYLSVTCSHCRKTQLTDTGYDIETSSVREQRKAHGEPVCCCETCSAIPIRPRCDSSDPAVELRMSRSLPTISRHFPLNRQFVSNYQPPPDVQWPETRMVQDLYMNSKSDTGNLKEYLLHVSH